MRCWDLVPSFNSMKNEFMAATFLKFLSLVIQLIYGSMGAESASTKNFLYFSIFLYSLIISSSKYLSSF